MGRRVDVDDTREPAELPRDVLHELYAHARETLPEECCGLILGHDDERFARVVRCRNEMTRLHRADPHHYPLDGTQAFWMNAADYYTAHTEAQAMGQRVTAVYHSHVDSHSAGGVYLSDMDLAYAEHALFPFPDAVQLVIAVSERRVRAVGWFERAGPDQPFTGRQVAAPES